MTLSWPVQVRKVDPVNLSGKRQSCSASISSEVKVEATNFVGYLTLSWLVQVSKVDPVNVSGSCVTREAEGDLQGGSREAGTSGKVPASQGVTEAGSQGALCLEVDQARSALS